MRCKECVLSVKSLLDPNLKGFTDWKISFLDLQKQALILQKILYFRNLEPMKKRLET